MWLHGSVGGASRRYFAEVMGSNPVEALIFFQASSFQLLRRSSLLLRLFSWQFRFFVFHFHVVILLYNLAVFKSLLPVSRLVRRWYRFISKYNKLITSFPCICCLSSLVTMQLLGIAFTLYNSSTSWSLQRVIQSYIMVNKILSCTIQH